MRSLMFERSSVVRRSKIPMGGPVLPRFAVRRELTEMCRERQGHALVACQELIEIQMPKLERLGEDDRVSLYTIRAMHQVGCIELQKPPIEARRLPLAVRHVHHLHPQQHDRRGIMNDDVQIE